MREWRKNLKRLLVLALSVALIGTSVDLSALTVAASNLQAQENVSGGDTVSETNTASDMVWSEEETVTGISEVELPESEELFAGYVDKMFYGGFNFFGTSAREYLPSEPATAMYDELKDLITKVAAGEQSSTMCAPNNGNGVVFTYTNVTVDEAVQKSKEEMNIVIDALLNDCPYELYWYDKVKGYLYNYSYTINTSENVTTVSIKIKTMLLNVAGNYRPADYNPNSPSVDTSKTGVVSTAVANAQEIVVANASKSDYEKLIAYRDAICGLVSYNYDAVGDDNFSTNNDPWQMIYVFDKDTTTNVVCEGYSKAFQYLCDMSTFTNQDVTCYTVSGYMNGERHMWNIVTMEDGKNYLVDVTNSDSGMTGENSVLFLVGTTGSVADGYTFDAGNKDITYKYYDDTKTLWGTGTDSILNLSTTGYEPPKPYMPTTLRVGDVNVISGGVLGSTTSGTGWSYDSTNNTLTLSGGTITGTDCGIYVDGDLNIQVTGNTSVNSTAGWGISSMESTANETSTLKITIEGDAVLEVEGVTTGSYEGDNFNGIDCLGDLEISGGKLEATGHAGIYASGNLNVSDTAIYATGYACGISADRGLTVADSAINAIAKAEDCSGIGGNPVATDSILIDNNSDMTVAGNVTLNENITLTEGGSLTLEDGATLTIPDGITLDITKIDTASLGTDSSINVQDGGTLLCEHPNMDTTNYECDVCGGEYVATVQVESTVTYCKTFMDAIAAATTDGAVVTLLKNVSLSNDTSNSNNENITVSNDIILDLNDKSLDIGDYSLIFGDSTSTVKNGTLKGTHGLSTLHCNPSSNVLLQNIDLISSGTYGITVVPGSQLTIDGGSITSEFPAVSSLGTLYIKNSPELNSSKAENLEVFTDSSKFVISDKLSDDITYTLIVRDNGAGHDIISGADGVTLQENWFVLTESGDNPKFALELDEGENTISLLYNLEAGSNFVLDKDSFTYDGTVQTPVITISRRENNKTVTLTEGTDYTVQYRYGSETGNIVLEPTNAGFYLAEVTGKGDYVGTIKHGFMIEKAVIGTISDFTLTAPEPGAQPQTEITLDATLGYHEGKGVVTWSVGDIAFTGDKFGYNTAYTATVVLTADGNHQFTENTVYNAGATQYESAVVGTDTNGNSTLTLTKTFATTRKEIIISAGGLAGFKLSADEYCATAEEVIALLPATISCDTETGTVSFDIKWSFEGAFNVAFDAQNTFIWVVNDADLENYDYGKTIPSGSVTIENPSATTVTNKGTDKEITYDGNTYDVSQLFKIDPNAGDASYSVVTSDAADAGAGTLDGATLTITKAGKMTIQLTTAANGEYAAGIATAVLTVNKAESKGTVSVVNGTYDETQVIVNINSTTNPIYSEIYIGTDYNSDTKPYEAGEYTVTVTFAENDLYKGTTATADFIIEKATPKITGVRAVNTLYESTKVSEVELIADNMFVGTLELDGVTELAAGTKEYTYKFTPADTKNYNTVTGKVSLTVLENALESLSVLGAPLKPEYAHGEIFDLTGITIMAVYADGTDVDVTDAVTYDNELVAGQTEVVVTYQGKTASIPVTVTKIKLDLVDVIWQDVEYTYDGTEKSITFTDNIPEGVEVTYTSNKATDAGEYMAKAEISLAEGYNSDYYEIVTYPHHDIEFDWHINPKEINEDNVVYVLGSSLTYNGTEQTQTLQSVKADGLDVTYEIINNTATDAGAYTMDIIAKGNFMGSFVIPWSIAPKNISGAEVTLDGALTYNGTEQTQKVSSVIVDGIQLNIFDFAISDNEATNAGEYLLTVTANANSNFTGNATANWSIAKKDISAVEITLNDTLTYNGEEQTLDFTVGKVDGLDVSYDATGYKATNAGDYELTITANGNYTGTATKAWSIASKNITNAQIVLGDALTYNGAEQTQSISSVTVDGLTLKETDYDISGNTATDAGNYTLTITGKGNFSGNVAKAYSVAKASAPVIADVIKSYTYSAGSNGASVSIDLASLLPADFAATSYALAANDAAYVLEETVTAAGKLTYKVANTGNIGDTTILTVTATSKNYNDAAIKVVIKVTDKFITVLKTGSEVTVTGDKILTYGQKVGDLAFDTTKAVFVAEGTDTVVEGTLSWVTPETVYNVGQASPQWKFTPNDTTNYTELTGTMTIQVNKAVPTVTSPAVEVFTYHPEKTLADIILVGVDGSHTVVGNKVDVTGSWKFKEETIVPVVNNNGYVVVFTPEDTANYETVEKTVAVEVLKATPSVEVKPEAATITYGQTLADAALTGGKAAYEAGSTIDVDGSFAWKDTAVAPTVFNSSFTEYEVVFTPEDTDNYNNSYCTLALTVNKAPKAPNMPSETMNVAHGIDKVSKVILPENWSWVSEDADKELKVGEAETAVARYVGSDAGNYVVETVTVTITRASAPVQQPAITTAPDGVPFIYGNRSLYGWDVINKVFSNAKDGETIHVDMNGSKTVPAYVEETIQGKDITGTFYMNAIYSWTINGQSITSVSDENLGISNMITSIPAATLNKVCGGREYTLVTLDHNGEFGLTAILNAYVGEKHAGKYANLFYYNPAYGSLQFVRADEIGANGMAHLPYTSASEYVIVINDTMMSSTYISPKTGDTDMTMYYLYFIALAALAVGSGYVVTKKKRR